MSPLPDPRWGDLGAAVAYVVEPGRVIVNEVERVVDRPDCQVFEVDCTTKYARVLGYGGGGPCELLVFLETTGESLVFDGSTDAATVVRFTLPKDVNGTEWRVIADVARYTCTVVLYRPTYARDEDSGGSDE